MEYTLTRKEVAKLLGKDIKTVSRYIKEDKLHPLLEKRGRYELYIFNLEEVKAFKGGIDTTGGRMIKQDGTQGGKQDGKLDGTKDGTPYPEAEAGKHTRVNNLHTTEEEKQDGTQDRKQDGTQQGTIDSLIGTLNRAIDVLEEQAKNNSEELKMLKQVVDTQSRQIAELSISNREYKALLGLPTMMEREGKEYVDQIVKEEEKQAPQKPSNKQETIQKGKQGGKQDRKQGGTKQKKQQGTQQGTQQISKKKEKPQQKKKNKQVQEPLKKGSKMVNKDGNKMGNKGVQIDNVKQDIKQEKKQENKESQKEEKFNLFRWIFK